MERANNLKRTLEQGGMEKSWECVKWGNVKPGYPVYDKRKKKKKKKREGEEESGEEEEEEEGGGLVDEEAEEGEEEERSGSEGDTSSEADDDDAGTRKKLPMESDSESDEDVKKEVEKLCNSSVVASEWEGRVGKTSAREKKKTMKVGRDLAMKARIADREFYDTKRLEKRRLEVVARRYLEVL
jgi:hypothetical protein